MVTRIRKLLEVWSADRRPDFAVRNYLRRWHLFPVRSWIDRNIGNVYLHRFENSDLPVPHDHPYSNASLILAGRYLEHFVDGDSTMRRPGDWILRSSRLLHWLEVVEGPVWTLFFHGPRRREWGFQTGEGWIHHAEFTERSGRR